MALLAEGAGDLPAEPVSFLEQPGPFFQQLAVLGVGGLQAAQQGGVGGALAGGTGAAGDRLAAARSCWIWSRMSVWEYSQDRDTRALAATAAKVMGVPAWSSSRIARIALARVNVAPPGGGDDRLALSGRIGGSLRFVVACLQGRDDLFEVAATCRFILATRVCPRASAAEMICSAVRCCSLWWGETPKW